MGTKQPPREDTGKNQVASGNQHKATGSFTEKPERDDDRKDPCLADGGECNERTVDGRLTGEPSKRAAEEHNEKREERTVDGRYGSRQARELAERGYDGNAKRRAPPAL